MIGIDQGVPFVQVNGRRSNPGQPVQAGQWSHLAVNADGKTVTLFVAGRAASSLEAALPAMNTPAYIGADNAGQGAFTGAIDEVRVSKVARPAALLLADAVSQGADSRLAVFGPDEQQAGKSHFGYILAAMPLDAWIVVGVLGIMMALSWAIMIGKGRNFGAVSRANAAFMQHFREVSGVSLDHLAKTNRVPAEVREHSSLWRLYEVAVDELHRRHQLGYDLNAVTDATISAIRASMDGVMVRENERMASRMNWLSTTIEARPMWACSAR